MSPSRSRRDHDAADPPKALATSNIDLTAIIPRADPPRQSHDYDGPRLLSTASAAKYLCYRSTSGIRTAVMRGELTPIGAGPKRCHMFTIEELDRFVSARGARYARRCVGIPGDRGA